MSSSSHIHLSNISLFTLTVDNNANCCPSNSCSQTNNPLLQFRFHLITALLPTFTQLPTSKIAFSLSKDKKYNLGNFCMNGKSPTHLSSQKLIILPLPNFHLILLSNQFCLFLTSQILQISLHHRAFPIFHGHSHVLPWPVSRINYFLPQTYFLHPIPHFHLAKRAALNRSISLIPNPPSLIGEHTFSQATQTIFLPSDP